jgi:acetyl esterase/lipase
MTDGTVHLPARSIPLPETISAEARAFLSLPIFSTPEPVMPALDDIAGWKAHIAESNGRMHMFTGMRPPLDCRHEVIRLDHFDLYEIVPEALASEDHALLYVHGGAFIMGGGDLARSAAELIAVATGLRTFSVDYRMPPDHPYPAGLADTVAAWRHVLTRFPAEAVAIHGASAGANIAAAAVLKARDEGLALPGAVVLHSPVSDLRQVGDTFVTNQLLDAILKRPADWMTGLYAPGQDLTHPYVSPVFGDYAKGYPPTLLTSGTRDLLLSDTVRLHRAMRQGGVRAELHVWEAMCHGTAPNCPEAQELIGEQVRFTREALGLA